jgi:hypothetical protein
MELKSIGVLSCGKIMGAMYAAMGLILGGFMSLASMIGAAAGSQQEGGAVGAMFVGVGAIVVFPVLYGIGGFLGGLFMSLIYNLIAGAVGGLELNIVQRN